MSPPRETLLAFWGISFQGLSYIGIAFATERERNEASEMKENIEVV